jgi:hypothetical protein
MYQAFTVCTSMQEVWYGGSLESAVLAQMLSVCATALMPAATKRTAYITAYSKHCMIQAQTTNEQSTHALQRAAKLCQSTAFHAYTQLRKSWRSLKGSLKRLA